jgi:hypothetical protein
MSAFTTAERLINKHGRSLTLEKKVTAPADPNAPWDSNTTAPTTLVVTGVQDEYAVEQIGSTIEYGDIKFLVHGSVGTDIENYDSLLDGTKRFRIINVNPIRPGAFTYLYEIQARR